MSSPYVVLGDRPLDQWKVTELKEELRKRKLTIRGLKEDLVKRLDEAVRSEREENEEEDADNDSSSDAQAELPPDETKAEAIVSGGAENSTDTQMAEVDKKPENAIKDQGELLKAGTAVEVEHVKETNTTVDTQLDSTKEVDLKTESINDQGELLKKVTVVEFDRTEETKTTEMKQDQPAENDGLETSVRIESISETLLPIDGPNVIAGSVEQIKNDISKPQELSDPADSSLIESLTQNEAANATVEPVNDDSRSIQSDQFILPMKYQVSKADPDLGSQVVSDSVSTESVSIIENNELKVDVITDNVKLELDSKHEVVQLPLRNISSDGGESHQMDVDEPLDKKDVEKSLDLKISSEEIGANNPDYKNSPNNIDSGDLDPPEKLSLDRSSGDDSMEEDIVDTKQPDYKSTSSEIAGVVDKTKPNVLKEQDTVDVVGDGKPVKTEVIKAENETVSAPSSFKRKSDKEATGNNETAKKPRRWNLESHKGSEPQTNAVTPAKLEYSTQPSFKRFSRSDSIASEETPKDRVVPPPSKPPSTSLRIDRFLRPFTLKAVQELLGKTGTVTSFWMDNIKTHCYVSYSSIEEAVETRNAVYNLHWPPNGGRALLAEFVDPQEVKDHVEAPLPSPATPATPATPSSGTPASREQVLRQQLPPSSLPAPPALANPPSIRERLNPARDPPSREHPLPVRDRLNLPPPPPLAEKVEPPIVTLDDLFRKTRSIPRIYYLPLSDEQVAAKLKSKGNTNQ